MAAIVFDPLEFTHQLESSGVPRAQAEVHAKAMTTMFLHNLDALVTRDYLDVRFSEFETRIEGNMERRFVELESRLDTRFAEIDSRFVELDSRLDTRFAEIDSRFVELDSRLDTRFAEIDSRFVDLDSRLDTRFAEIGNRFVELDSRLGKCFAEIDVRFVELDSSLDKRFTEIVSQFVDRENSAETRFGDFRLTIREEIANQRGILRLHSWMLAILVAASLLPAMQKLLG